MQLEAIKKHNLERTKLCEKINKLYKEGFRLKIKSKTIAIIFLFMLISCKKDLTITIQSNYSTQIEINGHSINSDYYSSELKKNTQINSKDSCHYTIRENEIIIFNQFTNQLNFKNKRKI